MEDAVSISELLRFNESLANIDLDSCGWGKRGTALIVDGARSNNNGNIRTLSLCENGNTMKEEARLGKFAISFQRYKDIES